MISFEAITKRYNHVIALSEVSFNVNVSEITGLIGENGAGKTTSLRLLTRYMKPDSGEIFIDAKKIGDISSPQNNISYIPDEPVYYDFMTVMEHLRFIKSMYPAGEYSIEELIEMFSLEEHLDKFPHTLSKGNKQKLMICMALLRNYTYLIADEPFSALDPVQISNLKSTLIELRAKGKGILLSTHLLDLVEKLCDHYIMLDKGKVLAQGNKHEIAIFAGLSKDSTFEEIYLSLKEKKPTRRPNRLRPRR